MAVLFAALFAPAAQALPEPPARKSDNVTWKATLDEPNVVSARFSADAHEDVRVHPEGPGRSTT